MFHPCYHPTSTPFQPLFFHPPIPPGRVNTLEGAGTPSGYSPRRRALKGAVLQPAMGA